jgi:hypothetical protein
MTANSFAFRLKELLEHKKESPCGMLERSEDGASYYALAMRPV